MPYFCTHCGNETSFSASENFTESGTRTVSIDAEGDFQETIDTDYSGDCDSDGYYDIECAECNLSVSNYEEGEELEQAKREYLEGQQPQSIKALMQDQI